MTHPTIASVPHLLLAAKRAEIRELRRLAHSADLVGAIGQLMHALQNERGASSIYLASQGARFAAMRAQLAAASEAAERSTREAISAGLEHSEDGSARKYSLMAWALHGLETLPALRGLIDRHGISPHEAVAAFSRLMAGLVSLIFEAADTAYNPALSRRLVALFNLVQGKEFAGQERAVGALLFASGRCDAVNQARHTHLIEAQERCFQTLLSLSDDSVRERWTLLQDQPASARLERLRRTLLLAAPDSELDPELSDTWFEACSARLTEMWTLQTELVAALQAHGDQLIEEAERELQNSQGLLRDWLNHPPESTRAVDRFFDAADTQARPPGRPDPSDVPAKLGPALLSLLQAQSDRLTRMGAELDAARRSLHERKLIERAKGHLMARLQLSEEAAYKMLRQTSMKQNRRLIDVAEAVLTLPHIVGPGQNSPE